MTVKGEGDNVTAVSCSAEDIQSVVDVLQMNADDGAKAVANVQSERLNYLGESVTVFIVCHSHG